MLAGVVAVILQDFPDQARANQFEARTIFVRMQTDSDRPEGEFGPASVYISQATEPQAVAGSMISSLPPKKAGSEVPPESGEIVVTGIGKPPKEDPLQAVNVQTFKAVEAVNRAIIDPVTKGYMRVLPRPLRRGLHNALNNLDEPIVFVNFLLQLKIGKAFKTLARAAINTTAGVGGLIDLAAKKPINLPRRSNGLADTLGYYGVHPGPYFFLPVIGSTTLRDVIGRVADLSLVPMAFKGFFKTPAYTFGKGALAAIDERIEFDENLKKIRNSDSPYATARELYLQRRKADIEALKSKQ